jgi:protein SCO1/2
MQFRSFGCTLIAALLAGLGLSCRQNVPAPSAGSAAQPQVYQVKGVVREVVPEKLKVKIEHEEIPGYMEKMTMMFDVKDQKELAGLQANDSVSFRMIVTEDDGWIDQIRKSGSPSTAPPAAETFRRTRDVDPLSVGDAMPDYQFTNQLGQVVRLSDFKGRAYAFTFIFTRCPFPTFCPQLSRSFQQAQTALEAMSNGPTNWHLFSITIDPQFDTPAVLQDYAKRQRANPERWSFLTAALIDIDAIGEQFGLQFWRTSPDALPNHNVRTVVVDATGRVQWVSAENEWKPEALAEQIVKAAAAR